MSKIVLLIMLSIAFDLLNGMRDGGNFTATVVSSRALSLRQSLWVAAIAVLFGPLLVGVSVAYTFGQNLVRLEAMNLNEILAALLAAVVWNFLTWWLSMPSSSTHAVLGGLLGAVIVGAGCTAGLTPAVLRTGDMTSPGGGAILINGLERVLISLFISPLLGLLAGFLVTKLVFFLARYATPRINIFFRQVQLPTEIFLALSYGGNDAQKTMGLIPMGLVIAGLLPSFRVPVWVMLLSAGVTALGVILSGQRLIRTLGGRFYKIRPVHGFSSQLSGAMVILGAALLGGPVSSSQVITSSILGVGSADRINQVRWRLAGSIVQSWLLTIPVCALLGGLSYLALVAMTGF